MVREREERCWDELILFLGIEWGRVYRLECLIFNLVISTVKVTRRGILVVVLLRARFMLLWRFPSRMLRKSREGKYGAELGGRWAAACN